MNNFIHQFQVSSNCQLLLYHSRRDYKRKCLNDHHHTSSETRDKKEKQNKKKSSKFRVKENYLNKIYFFLNFYYNRKMDKKAETSSNRISADEKRKQVEMNKAIKDYEFYLKHWAPNFQPRKQSDI